MNAPATFVQFESAMSDPLIITATLWRGAMIDRFSQIERHINRAISRAIDKGWIKPSLRTEIFFSKRVEAVAAAVADHGKTAGTRALSANLAKLIGVLDDRNRLAHGWFSYNVRQVSVEWQPAGGGLSSKPYSDVEMLESLITLDKLARGLACQLGSFAKGSAP